jgi:hypothetical protein
MRETKMLGIADNHRKIVFLRTAMKPKPQPETVGERDFFLNRIVRMDRGPTLIFDHFARKDVAPVRSCLKEHICGAPLDSAFERSFERLIARILCVEGEIVAKDEESPFLFAQQRHEARQPANVLAMYLDKF